MNSDRNQDRTMAHHYDKLGSGNILGPKCQKCYRTTSVSTEGHRQMRRKKRYGEEREEVWKGKGSKNRKAKERSWRRYESHGTSSCHMAVVSATTVIQHWASSGGYNVEWHSSRSYGAYLFDKSII